MYIQTILYQPMSRSFMIKINIEHLRKKKYLMEKYSGFKCIIFLRIRLYVFPGTYCCRSLGVQPVREISDSSVIPLSSVGGVGKGCQPARSWQILRPIVFQQTSSVRHKGKTYKKIHSFLYLSRIYNIYVLGIGSPCIALSQRCQLKKNSSASPSLCFSSVL